MNQLESFAPRNIPQQVQEFLDFASGLTARVVDFGSDLLWDCNRKSEQNDECIPFLFGLHALEMLDAGSILFSKGIGDPAIPLLRSSLEAFLFLRYVIEQDQVRRRRCFIVHDQNSRIREFEGFAADPSTGQSPFQQSEDGGMAIDPRIKGLDWSSRVDEWRKTLTDPMFKEIHDEWLRLNTKADHTPKKMLAPWHALFGGAKEFARAR